MLYAKENFCIRLSGTWKNIIFIMEIDKMCIRDRYIGVFFTLI